MSAAFPEDASRADLDRLQDCRLAELIRSLLSANAFYAAQFAQAGIAAGDVRGRADLHRLPFTTKAELLADQAERPPYGSNLGEPLQRYCRLHQTSGTVGRPLRWLDTPQSWAALLDTWAAIFRIVGLRPGERLFFPFSFGPFIGFWTAFEAGARAGHLCLTGGGMSSSARLRFLRDNGANVVFCTPTYALRLAEVAAAEHFDLRGCGVRALIVAGEPGGSLPGTRDRIESAWGARVFDHNGMTEVGPAGVECPENPGGVHILEQDHLAEVIDPDSGQPVPPGTPGELVLTTLHRTASPVLRYRTGDLVCADPRPCPCGRALLRLDGGIRGRVDDMLVVRGNNLHPAALQALLHRFDEVTEFRVEVDRGGPLAVLRVDLELAAGAGPAVVERIGRAIHDELLFRAEVRAVPPGTLPRHELKARRVVRKNAGGVGNDAAP
jgi:phenylacetate-CoA ligase